MEWYGATMLSFRTHQEVISGDCRIKSDSLVIITTVKFNCGDALLVFQRSSGPDFIMWLWDLNAFFQ